MESGSAEVIGALQHDLGPGVAGAELAEEVEPSMPSGRRLARAVAVQALYESDMTNRPAGQCLVWLSDEFGLREKHLAHARKLVAAVEADRDGWDARIDHHARWSRSHAPDVAASELVLRNVLRVAMAELGDDFEPNDAVVINEAIEVAKLLANDGGGRFVHGVLGAVSRARTETR